MVTNGKNDDASCVFAMCIFILLEMKTQLFHKAKPQIPIVNPSTKHPKHRSTYSKDHTPLSLQPKPPSRTPKRTNPTQLRRDPAIKLHIAQPRLLQHKQLTAQRLQQRVLPHSQHASNGDLLARRWRW